MPGPSDDPHRALNEAASAWMHRGMDLAESGTPGREELEQAIRCFDEAIALRRTLPLGEHPPSRYGLSAGWVNRADAWARLPGGASLDEAVRSYGEALALLETLALEENPLYPRRLAITRLNLGVALQKREAPGDAERAAAAFRGTLDVLDRFSGFPDHGALQAAAWSNLAGTLASLGQDAIEPSRAAARRALALAKPQEAAMAPLAEAALGARHTLCRLLVRDLAGASPVPDALAAEATDAVEEALASIRLWNEKGRPDLARREREFVRFGCRIYGAAQPRFLAEFVVERLGLDGAGTGPLDSETFAAAQAGIWAALGRLQAGGFGEPGALLGAVGELRAAQERLARRAP